MVDKWIGKWKKGRKEKPYPCLAQVLAAFWCGHWYESCEPKAKREKITESKGVS